MRVKYLAQGYNPGIEPMTFRLQDQLLTQYTTLPHKTARLWWGIDAHGSLRTPFASAGHPNGRPFL
uniref:Uncharacterized protein n=1 Tax=Anguilla anguilla TaxID=7936 RepID=A0A0E9T100_ANGAN